MDDGEFHGNTNQDSQLREVRASPTTPQRSLFGRDESNIGSGMSTTRKLRRSPQSRLDLRDSPLSRTPVLREPSPQEVTPEPRKVERRRKYGDLGANTRPAAAGAATVITAASASNSGRRSVSDQVTRLQSPRFDDDKTPTPSPSSPSLARRRSASNTSLARHRTPEPIRLVYPTTPATGASATGRPESPASGIIRQTSATPPLRRVDRRVSGDLRSLSQRSRVPTSPAPSTLSQDTDKQHAAKHQQQQDKDRTRDSVAEGVTTGRHTPVANEGRVRSKGMADVYVSLIFFLSFSLPASSFSISSIIIIIISGIAIHLLSLACLLLFCVPLYTMSKQCR